MRVMMRQKTARLRQVGALLWKTGAAAAGLLSLIVATQAQFGLRPQPPNSSFFRFTAEYTVKATGEKIKFDLVRPCDPQYARDVNGSSIGLGPGKFNPNSYFWNVGIFPKVTADHHLISVHIPHRCGQWSIYGTWPEDKDLLPWTAWFDDADTMEFGWMYASEDAYQSPLAKITFDGASIRWATEEEFIHWEDHAAEGFRPSKLVTHPFGFTYNDRVTKGIPEGCTGVRRVAVPPEVRELARAVWPLGHPRYWYIFAGMDRLVPTRQAPKEGDSPVDFLRYTLLGKGRDKYLFEGHNMGAYIWGSDAADFPQTIPTRGRPGSHELRPPAFFPNADHPYRKPFIHPEKFAQQDLYYDIDTSPELRGFLTCYRGGSVNDPEARAVVGDFDWHRIVWRINGAVVAGQFRDNPRAPGGPSLFFENDEYYYTSAWDGL
ncbi:hypothetical protein ACVIGB_001094 [Bradyrhizobium sp. USDA 4341]